MYGFKPGAKPEEKAPKGKKIVGPGTGTSDSIPAKIPKGSYIMPADSTQQIGPKALGELGQPVPVNVSNGEYQMPPEQVHAVGVQALNQMRDATHMPTAAGFKPQKDGLYFADGGLIADAAQYWANDNEQFEAGNPSFGSRVVRALNPVTSFGSAMGAMHTAAGSGDKTGMALAAAQAVPVFGAMRPVITPAMGAVKAARAMAPSAAQTGAAIAGSGATGAMADAYGSPAVAAEPQQSSAAFSDMQREPNIPRREEPRLGFAHGGSPAEEERRRLPGNPLAVTYGDMTGRPSAGMAPRPQQAAVMPAVTYNDMQRAPNVPRTGQPRQMPQGEPLGASGIADGLQAAGQRAAAGIQGAVDQVAQAGRGFMAGGQAMTDQAATAAGSAVDAASGALTYLNRGDPVRDAANAIGGFFSRSSQQARGASYGGQPETAAAPQPVAAPPATTPPSAAPSAPAGDPQAAPAAAQSAPAAAAPTQQPMQGPALGMRVSPTSAPEINRIDNAPGLNSPLFTNLPAGQAVSEMQGGTVNTMPAAAFQSAGPAASRETSAALQAAAARGDWDAVRGFYQRDGGTWQGRTAEQDAAESQGPKGGAIGSSRFGFNFARRSEDRAADRALTDRRARAAEGLSRDRLDIDRQRAEGEAQTRGFEVRGMQRLERLYQQFEAAETPEARAAIAEQIRILSGKDAPNRFTVVPGGQEVTEQGLLRTVPSMVLNNQTGQLVDLGAPGAKPSPPDNHIAALKKNPAQAAQFDAIYGPGAAARYLGVN